MHGRRCAGAHAATVARPQSTGRRYRRLTRSEATIRVGCEHGRRVASRVSFLQMRFSVSRAIYLSTLSLQNQKYALCVVTDGISPRSALPEPGEESPGCLKTS